MALGGPDHGAADGVELAGVAGRDVAGEGGRRVGRELRLLGEERVGVEASPSAAATATHWSVASASRSRQRGCWSTGPAGRPDAAVTSASGARAESLRQSTSASLARSIAGISASRSWWENALAAGVSGPSSIRESGLVWAITPGRTCSAAMVVAPATTAPGPNRARSGARCSRPSRSGTTRPGRTEGGTRSRAAASCGARTATTSTPGSAVSVVTTGGWTRKSPSRTD